MTNYIEKNREVHGHHKLSGGGGPTFCQADVCAYDFGEAKYDHICTALCLPSTNTSLSLSLCVRYDHIFTNWIFMYVVSSLSLACLVSLSPPLSPACLVSLSPPSPACLVSCFSPACLGLTLLFLLCRYLTDDETASCFERMYAALKPGGTFVMRESCFKQSGNKARSFNPTNYRSDELYESLVGRANTDAPFKMVKRCANQTYIRIKNNPNQLMWLWQKPEEAA